MNRHYATLCDSNYLPRALTLYETLIRFNQPESTLHYLALDERAMIVMERLGYPNVKTYWLGDLLKKSKALQKAKSNRTWQEFCWTMGSYFTWYLLLEAGIHEVTYIDSDIAFFGDPEEVFDTIGKASIAIVPHRFGPDRKHLEVNGRFNVGWVTFRNTVPGLRCLNKWKEQCLEWCYYKVEPGRFGDQKYLDAWPSEYGSECFVIEHHGAGLAPWNLMNYDLFVEDDELKLNMGTETVNVIFYHYHEFKENGDGSYRYTNYPLRPTDVEYIYKPYLEIYEAKKSEIRAIEGGMNA